LYQDEALQKVATLLVKYVVGFSHICYEKLMAEDYYYIRR